MTCQIFLEIDHILLKVIKKNQNKINHKDLIVYNKDHKRQKKAFKIILTILKDVMVHQFK